MSARTRFVVVRFTPEEHAELFKATTGASLSVFVRRCVARELAPLTARSSRRRVARRRSRRRG